MSVPRCRLGQHVAQPGAESPCASGIVRYIQDELRGFVIMTILDSDGLEARRPAGVADTVGDRLGGNGESVADGKFDGGGNGKGDVAVLVCSAQRRGDLDRFAKDFNRVWALLICRCLQPEALFVPDQDWFQPAGVGRSGGM